MRPEPNQTRLGTTIALSGALFTAEGIAQMFLRLFPQEEQAVAEFLAALQRLRNIFNQKAEPN